MFRALGLEWPGGRRLKQSLLTPASQRGHARAALHLACWHSRIRRAVWWQHPCYDSSCEAANYITSPHEPAEPAKYRGVYYSGRDRIFAQAWLHGWTRYLGTFNSAKEAAKAFDHFLRTNCSADKLRLKNSLNFPSAQEAAYQETPEQARARGLKVSGHNYRKEAQAFNLSLAAFAKSEYSAHFEIQRLSGATRADAVFMRKGCPEECLLIQLKAASAQGPHGGNYHFCHVSGYTGMVVILVALEGGHIWAAAGNQLLKAKQWIKVGHPSAARFHVHDLGLFLVKCFEDAQQFPHMSKEIACLQCSPSNRVEANARAQLDLLFRCIGMRLTSPMQLLSTVDSLLELAHEGRKQKLSHLRLQEKAKRVDSCEVTAVSLSKCGGAMGRVAYARDDFDLLAACLLLDNRLTGLFLVPMPVLVERGFVSGERAVTMSLFPPWAPPQRNTTRLKYAWQPDFFVDLRDWNTLGDLAPKSRRQLETLVQTAAAAIGSKFNASRGVLTCWRVRKHELPSAHKMRKIYL